MRLINRFIRVVGTALAPMLTLAMLTTPAVLAASPSEPIVDARESVSDDLDWRFRWDNGFKLSRSDGAFKLKFGGRIMVDAGLNSLGRGLRSDFRAVDVLPLHGSGVEFRRARIFFSGEVYDRVFFTANYDFAQNSDDDNPDFKDVFVGLKRLGFVNAAKVGHFKEPGFLQEATSSKNITFIERGLNQAFFPGRNVGLMADGTGFEKKLFWQLGVYRDANDQGFSFDDSGDESWDLAGRVSMVPIYREGGKHVLHAGAGFIHRFLDAGPSGNLRFRSRPSAHLAQYFVDTEGRVDASDSNTLNLELAYVRGPFSAQAEYTYVWVEGNGAQRDLRFRGFYAFASVFLTGEHRNYQLGKGKFDRVIPSANFDPANGNWGAIEIAIRYGYLDLVSRDVRGGELWDLTVGVNWHLFPNFRWMLNYVHADVTKRVATFTPKPPPIAPSISGRISGAGNMVATRFQFDF